MKGRVSIFEEEVGRGSPKYWLPFIASLSCGRRSGMLETWGQFRPTSSRPTPSPLYLAQTSASPTVNSNSHLPTLQGGENQNTYTYSFGTLRFQLLFFCEDYVIQIKNPKVPNFAEAYFQI